MAEGGDGARLALEPREPFGVGGHVAGQDLDRDLAPETRVPRPVDLAHPPAPRSPRISYGPRRAPAGRLIRTRSDGVSSRETPIRRDGGEAQSVVSG